MTHSQFKENRDRPPPPACPPPAPHVAVRAKEEPCSGLGVARGGLLPIWAVREPLAFHDLEGCAVPSDNGNESVTIAANDRSSWPCRVAWQRAGQQVFELLFDSKPSRKVHCCLKAFCSIPPAPRRFQMKARHPHVVESTIAQHQHGALLKGDSKGPGPPHTFA